MNQPIQVALLDHTAKPGGGEIALFNFATRLDRTGFNPLVILFSDGPLRNQLEGAGVRVLVETLNPRVTEVRKDSLGGGTLLRVGDLFHSLKFAWRLSRVLKREKIRVVHTNSLKADVIGGVAAKLARLPLIWHVRDRIDPDYLPRSVVFLFRILARWMPTRIIANSAATARTIGQSARLKGLIEVVHDGTQIRPDSAGNPEKSSANPAPIIGLVGRITPWKGQHIFIRAAGSILAKFPTAKFQIIGSALFDEKQYEQQLRELTVQLRLQDAIEFLGFRDDVPDLIAAMDVLVHASTTGEPFGQVIVEGMAAGKPVVATNGGGVPEIVVDNVTGLLVPMGDVDALAEAVCRLLRDPARARDMGAAGLRRVQQHFTLERTTRHIEQVYNDLLARFGVAKPATSDTPQSTASIPAKSVTPARS